MEVIHLEFNPNKIKTYFDPDHAHIWSNKITAMAWGPLNIFGINILCLTQVKVGFGEYQSWNVN